jgi:hypothetical protein
MLLELSKTIGIFRLTHTSLKVSLQLNRPWRVIVSGISGEAQLYRSFTKSNMDRGWQIVLLTAGQIKCCREPRVYPAQKNVRWIANLDRFCGSMEAWHWPSVDSNQTPGTFQVFMALLSHIDPSLAEDNWTSAFNTVYVVQTDRLEMSLMSTLL